MTLYDLIVYYMGNGYSKEEASKIAFDEYCQESEEVEQDFFDDYYDRCDIRFGLAQQDLIEMHRYEQ